MYGHGVVRGIFETVEGDNLRGFAIWGGQAGLRRAGTYFGLNLDGP